MTKKLALCRVSDTEPLLSILPMLEGAGYECVLPDRGIRDYLRTLGGNNVDEFVDMHRRWGAEMPPDRLREARLDVLDKLDLYVDVNGLNGLKLAEEHPNMKGKILCYFINGGEPRNVTDKGDCQTPAFPMMTTAQHYRSTLFCPNKHWNVEAFSCDDPPLDRGYWTNRELSHPPRCSKCLGSAEMRVSEDGEYGGGLRYSDKLVECERCKGIGFDCPHGCGPLVKAPWLGKVYTFWPKFTRWERVEERVDSGYAPPVSFVHNSMSWGGQAWWPWADKLGVKSYGGGNSPSGLRKHEECFSIYQSALCTVYLKSGGAVDYSILEPMACGCPTTFHESYIHNCRLYDLLIPEVTCLTWSDERSMADCIERLRDLEFNRKIGTAGRERIKELLWDERRDLEDFKAWMGRMFP